MTHSERRGRTLAELQMLAAHLTARGNRAAIGRKCTCFIGLLQLLAYTTSTVDSTPLWLFDFR